MSFLVRPYAMFYISLPCYLLNLQLWFKRYVHCNFGGNFLKLKNKNIVKLIHATFGSLFVSFQQNVSYNANLVVF